MASRILATARQAANISRISYHQSFTPSSNLLQRRGLAGAAEHHGPAKVNCWSDPMSPSIWKEEHFVIVSLTGWGILFYSGFKFFTGGKGKEEKVAEASH